MSCQNGAISKNDLTDSTAIATPGDSYKVIIDSTNNASCRIDSSSIKNYKDERYRYHTAIFEILNGRHKNTIVDGKLATMFQYSFFPNEDSMYYHLTNRVVTDLILKSQQRFHLDFKYEHTPFHDYDYFIYHVKHPECLNVTLDIYIDSVENKIIATSDSTVLIKKNTISELRSRINASQQKL